MAKYKNYSQVFKAFIKEVKDGFVHYVKNCPYVVEEGIAAFRNVHPVFDEDFPLNVKNDDYKQWIKDYHFDVLAILYPLKSNDYTYLIDNYEYDYVVNAFIRLYVNIIVDTFDELGWDDLDDLIDKIQNAEVDGDYFTNLVDFD